MRRSAKASERRRVSSATRHGSCTVGRRHEPRCRTWQPIDPPAGQRDCRSQHAGGPGGEAGNDRCPDRLRHRWRPCGTGLVAASAVPAATSGERHRMPMLQRSDRRVRELVPKVGASFLASSADLGVDRGFINAWRSGAESLGDSRCTGFAPALAAEIDAGFAALRPARQRHGRWAGSGCLSRRSAIAALPAALRGRRSSMCVNTSMQADRELRCGFADAMELAGGIPAASKRAARHAAGLRAAKFELCSTR